jgi:hypothetical protein
MALLGYERRENMGAGNRWDIKTTIRTIESAGA